MRVRCSPGDVPPKRGSLLGRVSPQCAWNERQPQPEVGPRCVLATHLKKYDAEGDSPRKSLLPGPISAHVRCVLSRCQA